MASGRAGCDDELFDGFAMLSAQKLIDDNSTHEPAPSASTLTTMKSVAKKALRRAKVGTGRRQGHHQLPDEDTDGPESCVDASRCRKKKPKRRTRTVSSAVDEVEDTVAEDGMPAQSSSDVQQISTMTKPAMDATGGAARKVGRPVVCLRCCREKNGLRCCCSAVSKAFNMPRRALTFCYISLCGASYEGASRDRKRPLALRCIVIGSAIAAVGLVSIAAMGSVAALETVGWSWPPSQPPLRPPSQPPAQPPPPSPPPPPPRPKPPPQLPPNPPPSPPPIPPPSNPYPPSPPEPRQPPYPPPTPQPPAYDSCPQRAGLPLRQPRSWVHVDYGQCDCSWTEKWPCGSNDASKCWRECCGATTPTDVPRGYLPGDPLRANGPVQISFYAYRAVSNENYPAENVNVGNIEGVMLYLHNEVLQKSDGTSSWRKFGITKIKRYKITMKSTQAAYNQDGGPGLPQGVKPQFTQFSAFDFGKAASGAPGMPSMGCIATGLTHWNYPGRHAYGENATYYSLPGGCYNRYLNNGKVFHMTHGPHAGKATICSDSVHEELACEPRRLEEMMKANRSRSLEEEDGNCFDSQDRLVVLCKGHGCSGGSGRCDNPDGTSSCTWRADPLGEVSIDELEGKPASLHQQGGVCFWAGKDDPQACKERVLRLDQMFRNKYPTTMGDIPGPKCGW